MNTFFENTVFAKMSKFKIIALLLVALFVTALVLSVIKVLIGSVMDIQGRDFTSSNEYADSMAPSGIAQKSLLRESGSDGMSQPALEEGNVIGSDAEAYEARSYDVLYKKSSIEKICNTVESWKPLQYVVFESATRRDTYCAYHVKVARDQVTTVLGEIEKLDPEELTAHTETMKKQAVEYRGQLDILLRKQEILERTLEDSMSAYDSVTSLATQNENIESLTRIITNKLNDITRLTNERIALSQQIDTLTQRIAEVNDQIEYVYFSIRVQKNDVFNLEDVKDSWVSKMRQFVYGVNSALQDLTLGVLELFLGLLKVVVYGGIIGATLLVVGKYGWRSVKTFWSK
jgi:hypothetical protein